jgi:hypothetical protein
MSIPTTHVTRNVGKSTTQAAPIRELDLDDLKLGDLELRSGGHALP